jgi:hypothetical protein
MRYLNVLTVALAVAIAVMVPLTLAGVPNWITMSAAITAAWAVALPFAARLYPSIRPKAPLLLTTSETFLVSFVLAYFLLR